MLEKRFTRLAAITALALTVSACGEDAPSSPPAGAPSIADFVASASIAGIPGVLRTTAIPRPEDGAPDVLVDGPLTIVNGGTATLSVTSSTSFETVYVSASAPISGLFVPISGFFEIPMPVPAPSVDLVITFPQVLPTTDFELFFFAADPEGRVGSIARLSFDALVVGTGDIQVTVAWNTNADVDLHVVDPAGEEIYWADRTSVTGGQLDLDSNAGCAGDNVRNENITWDVGFAPQGTYTVRVDYWSNCEASQTKYTVLINNGGDIQIFSGTFTGGGDRGGFGSGVEIASFTRTEGPVLSPGLNRSNSHLPVGPTSK